MTDLAATITRLREALSRGRSFPVFSILAEDLTALLDGLEGKTALVPLSHEAARAQADMWLEMKARAENAEAALKIVQQSLVDHAVEQQDCPHTGSPLRYCEYRPDHVAVCPIGLPCRTFAEAQAHRANRGQP